MLRSSEPGLRPVRDWEALAAAEGSDGFRRFGDRLDFTGVSACPLGRSQVVYGSGCMFPSGMASGDDCRFGDKCVFGEGTSFGKRSMFGDGCRFRPGCTFGDGCEIGGHRLKGLCPMTLIQPPRIVEPLYLFGTEDGVFVYTSMGMHGLDEDSEGLPMLVGGDVERGHRVAELVIALAKELYR